MINILDLPLFFRHKVHFTKESIKTALHGVPIEYYAVMTKETAKIKGLKHGERWQGKLVYIV